METNGPCRSLEMAACVGQQTPQTLSLVPRVSLLCLPWSLQERTLVAAGHVTTQNLGGKNICWVGGVAEFFVWLM